MEITNDLLSRIIGGDSSSKVIILKWHIVDNIIESGNSHTSELSRLVVEYQRKCRIFKKSFILKIPSAHPAYTFGLKYNVYEREYPIYTTVLEEMYKIDGEHIGPRLYYAGEKYSLMLKDLSISGYKMVDRVQQLDFQQCSAVLQNIAKFHALSVKLNHSMKLCTKYNSFPWINNPETIEKTDFLMKNTLHHFENMFDLKSPKLSEIIAELSENCTIRVLSDLINSDNFNFNVLNHGDLWTGNTLFKSDRYGVVKKVKLIDFQKCLWTSPANDIWFFTITSMRFEVFEKHFDHLLEIYVDTLNKILSYLNCGSYSLQDLRGDLSRLWTQAIINIIVVLPQFVSTHENPFDFRGGEVIGEYVDLERYNKIYDNEVYAELMKKWISHFQKEGYLD